MRQLFGHKWASQAGPAKLENGHYSNEFLLWCRKLEGISDEQYQRAFQQLEWRVREAKRIGDEEWPPSYAGFLGLCDKPHGEMAHKVFTQPQLPDKAAQERSKQAGESALSDMKSLFTTKQRKENHHE